MDISQQLYIETPLIESLTLAETIRAKRVYLKLENTQPCGSFKLRGISTLILQEVRKGKKSLVASSGGNAGLAAAYSARKLNIPLTLVVPVPTKPEIIKRLKNEGTNLIIHGANWNEADDRAKEELTDKSVAYIHPFANEIIWEGHGQMIVEVASQMKEKPDLVVVSVGGGGLLMGICRGLDKVGWRDVPILAVETVGADSLHQAVLADRVVRLEVLTSIATTLATYEVLEEAFNETKKRPIISKVVSDRDTIVAISKFLDEHMFLVEPACGASLAALYSGLITDMQRQGELPKHLENVVVIVCGGVGVDYETLRRWKQTFNVE